MKYTITRVFCFGEIENLYIPEVFRFGECYDGLVGDLADLTVLINQGLCVEEIVVGVFF